MRTTLLTLCLLAGACQSKLITDVNEVGAECLVDQGPRGTTITSPVVDVWGGAADLFGQTKSGRWVGAAVQFNELPDEAPVYSLVFPYQSDIPIESTTATDGDGTTYEVSHRHRIDGMWQHTPGLRSGTWAFDVPREYLEARFETGVSVDLENVPVTVELPGVYLEGLLQEVDRLTGRE